MLITPRSSEFCSGAIVALGVISGAIVSYLTRLGIIVNGDGGLLFGLAVAVFVGSVAILAIRRGQIPVVGPRLSGEREAMRPTVH